MEAYPNSWLFEGTKQLLLHSCIFTKAYSYCKGDRFENQPLVSWSDLKRQIDKHVFHRFFKLLHRKKNMYIALHVILLVLCVREHPPINE